VVRLIRSVQVSTPSWPEKVVWERGWIRRVPPAEADGHGRKGGVSGQLDVLGGEQDLEGTPKGSGVEGRVVRWRG